MTAYLGKLLENFYTDHVSSLAMYFSVIHLDAHNYNIFRPNKDVFCGMTDVDVEPALDGKCKVQKL